MKKNSRQTRLISYLLNPDTLFLISLVWGILKVGDKTLTVKEAYDLTRAMRAKELATDLTFDMIYDGLSGNRIIQSVLDIFGNRGKMVSA